MSISTCSSGDGQFADVAQQVDAALEDVLLELGEIPGARAHPTVTASPDEARVGHDVLFPPRLVLHVHLIVCIAIQNTKWRTKD